MRKMRWMAMLALVASLGLAMFPSASARQSGRVGDGEALRVFGLTADGRLVSFRSDAPRQMSVRGAISGLETDTELVGIDVRPATGRLYGLGDLGGVYTINRRTADATLRARLDVALEGTSFGVDFNPTVDLLRIVSDTGQNLRANVMTGATLVDGDVNYPGPPVVAATGVTAVAYTNNDADANTATTLYDIDTMLDQVAIQAPANSGSLSPTGKLGVDAAADAGFDIYSEVRNGTTVSVKALAALTVNGEARLYEIRLVTGRALVIGAFRPAKQVIDIAIPLNQV